MLLYQLGLLLVLLPVCTFAPGFFFIRRLRWNALEKLCGSIGLSLILLYLASWGIYCVGARGNQMPVHPLPYAVVSLVSVAMAVVSWKDIGRLLRATAVRRALAGFGFLLLWTAILVAIIRNFSGGAWFGDWLEHFQRSLFFLQHFPAETQIFPGYALPARPPMMNVLTAFFLAQTADRFELFQLVFTFLNLLLFLPCYLMMPALGRRARRRTWLLVLLFASSPLVMQNTTYTWTKASAAFFVVLALWFYLAGWRKHDGVRTTAAFVSLAAGLVAHYSAGPYVVILALHYLLRVFPRRKNKWRELAVITAACGLLVGTWLLWSLAVYGPHITFASNSSVTSSQQYKGSNVGKIAANLYYTIVPVVVRRPSLLGPLKGQRTAGMVRDWFFVFYQVNLIFGMGLVSGPLVLWLAYRALRKRQTRAAPPLKRASEARVIGLQSGGAESPRRLKPAPQRLSLKSARLNKKRAAKIAPVVARVTPEQRFWQVVIVGGVLLGIGVVGERDPAGVAHLTTLSLLVLGLSMVAAVVPWRRGPLAILILAGCVVDFSCGVLLQAHVEGLDNTARSTVFPGMEFVNGGIETADPGPDALAHSAWSNWFTKHKLSAYDTWYRDLDRRYGGDPAFQAILPRYKETVGMARANDALVWQGWFGRHGGEVVFLGDHVAAWSGALQVLLVMLFVGLAGWVYWRTE